MAAKRKQKSVLVYAEKLVEAEGYSKSHVVWRLQSGEAIKAGQFNKIFCKEYSWKILDNEYHEVAFKQAES